jgi:hypothetical protein
VEDDVARSEGKLFYSAEMLAQVAVAPGLMRQSALVEGKVMQGELMRVVIVLTGAGEVTRVQGEQVLAWNVEPVANSAIVVSSSNSISRRKTRSRFGANADATLRISVGVRRDAVAARRRNAFRRPLSRGQ